MALAVAGVLTAASLVMTGQFGKKDRVRYEAEQVVNRLWELRAHSTRGMRNPCMDFPNPTTVRLYRDSSTVPQGFGAGDALIESYTYGNGVLALSITGGTGADHFICFGGRGIAGAAGAPLLLELVRDNTRKTIRLLPATGIAKIL